ncbi:hypothetical protein ASPACDRAFT_1853938 [Aspergillus aculeatus ATCC 16872]|uniref:glutathione transferase n=1 Tax=Aspergillus aculeatus (strain ATCC 16872 / CBS 172.66 / WB 5094) TaxID=690307 RepID=A0A1L9X0T8_ASPA1|nr:uncharacterized protein ASPACDRAFT_1853938 [Aspergillus aculeatus ATCC 16872]OJK01899.1 hypothetical protein ASPACDRAFT_1853938 [Aspergillus aculeatus ATCC 16872]
MALKLYGSAMSIARVLVTLYEKPLPFEFIRVNIAQGEHITTENKKMQPFGKVPVLEDEEDYKAYGRFEQACTIEQSYFAAAAETLRTELVIERAKGLSPPDQARVRQAEADLDHVFAVYEEILGRQKYLAGDELTLADLFHLPLASTLKAFGYQAVFERYPSVDRWFKGLQGPAGAGELGQSFCTGRIKMNQHCVSQ